MDNILNNDDIVKLILELQKKYPNDTDLGKEVRKLIIKNKKD
jgi:hypothetical protein